MKIPTSHTCLIPIIFVIMALSYDVRSEDRLIESNGVIVEYYQKENNENMGPEFDFNFSEQDILKSKSLLGHIRIIKQASGLVLFDGQTPSFSDFFVSPNGEVIAYHRFHQRALPNLMVFDNQGDIIFQGIANIYLERFEENSIYKISAVSDTSYPNDNSSRLMNVSFQNESSTVEDEVSRDEEEQRVVIIGCSRISTWIDKVVSVEYDDEEGIRGFWFTDGGELTYFDINMHLFMLKEEAYWFTELLLQNHSEVCKNTSYKSYYNGSSYTHWCEDESGQRLEEMHRWTKLDQYDIENRDQLEFETDLEMLGDFYLSMYGRYDEFGRTGSWTEYFFDGTEECFFNNDQLNGQCEEFDEGDLIWSASFEDGLANGLDRTFYSNGMVELEQTRLDGRLEGLSTEYHSNGQISYLVNYSEGKEYGTAYSYDREGGIVECSDYINGELVKHSTACSY